MTKEVKLKPLTKEEAVEKEVKRDDKEELVKQLSQEEINVQNSKNLRKQLKSVQHNDLLGFILLYNDNKSKKVAVMSSLDKSVSQFVALAHAGYIDQYDQIINQIITTRTLERLKGQSSSPPGMKVQKKEDVEQPEENETEEGPAGDNKPS